MGDATAQFDPVEIARQVGWIRRLARSLVREAATADDVAQDTWLAALAEPAGDRLGRPWFAAVLRNFVRRRARDDRRRIERERRAAEVLEEPTPGAETLLARHELQRRIAGHVSALPEPYRSTLLACYAEGRTPSDLARQLDIPAGTVRWRLKQALDQIRQRLDVDHGGDRASWLGALAPLAGAERGSFVKGALLVKMQTKVVGAGLAIVLATGGLVLSLRDANPAAAPSVPTPLASPAHDVAVAKPRSPGSTVSPRAAVTTVARGTRLAQVAGTGPVALGEGYLAGRHLPGPPSAVPLDKFYAFTQDELVKLAENCEVRADIPSMKTNEKGLSVGWMTETDVHDLGLPAGEDEIVWKAIRASHERYLESLRTMYRGFSGSEAAIKGLDPDGLESKIEEAMRAKGLGLETMSAGARQVARELAGLEPPPRSPDDGPLTAPSYRECVKLGVDFEAALATDLGAARGSQIRRMLTGYARAAGCSR